MDCPASLAGWIPYPGLDMISGLREIFTIFLTNQPLLPPPPELPVITCHDRIQIVHPAIASGLTAANLPIPLVPVRNIATAELRYRSNLIRSHPPSRQGSVLG